MSDEPKDRAEQFRTVFRPSPLQDPDGGQGPLFGNLADPQPAAPKAPPPIPTAPPAAPIPPIYEQPVGRRGGGSVLPWVFSAILLIVLGVVLARYVLFAPDPTPPPAAAAPPTALPPGAQATRLAEFLAPEVRDDMIAVDEDEDTVRIRTRVDDMFKPGSAELGAGRGELLERIGKALEQENAKFIRVEAYATGERGALAQSRAEAAATVLRSAIADNRRIEAKGVGKEDVGGRTLDGRVEVVIDRQAEGAAR